MWKMEGKSNSECKCEFEFSRDFHALKVWGALASALSRTSVWSVMSIFVAVWRMKRIAATDIAPIMDVIGMVILLLLVTTLRRKQKSFVFVPMLVMLLWISRILHVQCSINFVINADFGFLALSLSINPHRPYVFPSPFLHLPWPLTRIVYAAGCANLCCDNCCDCGLYNLTTSQLLYYSWIDWPSQHCAKRYRFNGPF